MIIILLIISYVSYSPFETRKTSLRIGYFADISKEKSLDINGITEFAFEVSN